jgi:hypothetical protein
MNRFNGNGLFLLTSDGGPCHKDIRAKLGYAFPETTRHFIPHLILLLGFTKPSSRPEATGTPGSSFQILFVSVSFYMTW